MTAKELECLGIALDALMEANMYDAVRKVIKTMAGKNEDNKDKE